jgi:hypothetical protein
MRNIFIGPCAAFVNRFGQKSTLLIRQHRSIPRLASSFLLALGLLIGSRRKMDHYGTSELNHNERRTKMQASKEQKIRVKAVLCAVCAVLALGVAGCTGGSGASATTEPAAAAAGADTNSPATNAPAATNASASADSSTTAAASTTPASQ